MAEESRDSAPREREEKDDIFVQDEDDAMAPPVNNTDVLFKEEDKVAANGEDVFGQGHDAQDEQVDGTPKVEAKIEAAPKTENLVGQERDENEPEKPSGSTKVEVKTEAVSIKMKDSSADLTVPDAELMFELDTTPSEVPVSTTVPRKRASLMPSASQDLVPRKSQSKINASSADGTTSEQKSSSRTPSTDKTNGSLRETPKASTFGLPDEVIIPATINPSLLEGRILDSLKQLPTNLINDALQEYDDAIKQQKHIRSYGAYLFGVLKRYLSVHERASGGGSMMGKKLTPEVQAQLNRLVTEGFVTQEEMNEKVQSKIRMLSEKDALFAIDEFSGVDRGSIRNVGSYFMGILNRYMRGDHSNKDRRGSRNDMPGRDDRRNDRGRSPDRGYDGRDRPRHGNARNDEYARERSRDRYDSNRNNHIDRSNYDPHRQQQPQYARQSMPPPPTPRQQYGQQQPGMYQPQQQNLSLPQHHGGFQQAIPQMSSNISNQMPSHQPVHNQFIQTPIVGHQHLHVPPQMTSPQMTAPIMNPVGAPNRMPYMLNHVMTPVRPGFVGTPNQPVLEPAVPAWLQQQQQQYSIQRPGGPADILGIAAKAAQALAASQNILQTNNRHPPADQPAVVPRQHFPVQQPHHQRVNPGFQQHQSPPQHNQYQQQQQQPSPQQYPPPARRGRTIAKMHELPIAVQFSVQNLQTIGHISGPLDEGMLGMIRDLPEPMALVSLNRFATLDTSGMRNTTAYLAGVLKRELEKINRR